jgi:hypothetical protein
MKHSLLAAALFIFVSSKAQLLYYDAVKLRNAIRWDYAWNVKIITTAGNNTDTINVTMTDIRSEKYPTGFHRPDSVIVANGSTKRFVFGAVVEKLALPIDADVKGILTFYYKDPAESNFQNVLKDYKDHNPFIGPMLPAGGGAGAGGATNFLAKLVSGAGNLDVTAFADGLAKFLVERTKEELNEAFFRKFADFIDHYPEFRTLFPYTNTFVSNFSSWEYSNLLNTLREAFDKDIKELLANFVKLKDIDGSACHPTGSNTCTKNWCSDCSGRLNALHNFLTTKNEGRFLLSAARIGNGLLQSEKLPDILNAVTHPDFLLGYTDADHPELVDDIKNSLQLANIFSLSLKSDETGRNYITEEQFNRFATDPVLRDLYFGLVFQQVANSNGGAGIKINHIVVTAILQPAIVDGFKSYVSNVYDQVKNLQKTYDKLLSDKLDAKADLGQDYAAIFESTQSVLKAISSTSVIHSGLQFPTQLNDAFNSVSKALTIAHDISVRNYNAAVIGTLKFICDATRNYVSTSPQLQEFAQAFLKYGSFASNVVLSKDPDEVKEAIKSFVLPSGSSSLKKHNFFTISLNSYVGFVYGKTANADYATKDRNGNDSTVKLNGGKSIAVYAPLGIGFNFGWGWKKKNPGSVTAFISLIDIGAIVGYRFVTDSGDVSQKFKISLQNIFAPGGNLIIGLPNMPLSIGGGAQWIPVLQRDPKSNEFYNVDHSGLRWQVFVAVDLPLLNVHSSRHALMYVKYQK